TPATDTWRTRAAMPRARFGPGLTLGTDGRLYAIGGHCCLRRYLYQPPDTYYSTVEVYDVDADAWTAGTPMETPRSRLAVVTSAGGRFYALGGSNPADTLSDLEEYTPAGAAPSTASDQIVI